MATDFDKLESKAKKIFDDLYDKLEGRVKNLSNQIKDSLLPETEEKLKKNIFKSVFISFGVGFILGLLVTIFGINGGKKKKK